MSTNPEALDPLNATLFADTLDRISLRLENELGHGSRLLSDVQHEADVSRALAEDAIAAAAAGPDSAQTAEAIRKKVQQTRGFGAALEATPAERAEFIDSLTREEMDAAPEAYRSYVVGYFAGAQFAEEHGIDAEETQEGAHS